MSTCLRIKDVDGKGFEDIDIHPRIACPEKGAVSSEGLNIDEIEFMILIHFALPFGTHRLARSLLVYRSTTDWMDPGSK